VKIAITLQYQALWVRVEHALTWNTDAVSGFKEFQTTEQWLSEFEKKLKPPLAQWMAMILYAY
jgi:hypothetical protein